MEQHKRYIASYMFEGKKQYKVFSHTSADRPSGDELHEHDYMQIWFVTKGTVEHWVEGKSHTVTKGDCFLLPPHVTHKTIMREGTSIICCEFLLQALTGVRDMEQLKETLLDFSFTNLLLSKENIHPKFTLSPENQQQAEQLMHRLLKEYKHPDAYSEQFIYAYILEILLIFTREYSKLSDYSKTSAIYGKYKVAIEQALEYIEKNYTRPISLEDICKVSTISRTYFCSLFKMMMGQTFVSYLSEVRIRHAAELLSQTDRSVTEICFDLGFNDLTHFSRTFKKIMGMSAREYRMLHSADEK